MSIVKSCGCICSWLHDWPHMVILHSQGPHAICNCCKIFHGLQLKVEDAWRWFPNVILANLIRAITEYSMAKRYSSCEFIKIYMVLLNIVIGIESWRKSRMVEKYFTFFKQSDSAKRRIKLTLGQGGSKVVTIFCTKLDGHYFAIPRRVLEVV